jgi:ABC-type transport system substrate-binding protein
MYVPAIALPLTHAQIVKRDLRRIGIDVEVKAFPLDEMFVRLGRPSEGWDIGYFNWFPDISDASDLIGPLFGKPDGLLPGFHDAEVEREVRAALRIADEDARTDAFARLDAELTRDGAAAPFGTAVTTDFFSDRVGCQVQQPLYGISLGALCLRR